MAIYGWVGARLSASCRHQTVGFGEFGINQSGLLAETPKHSIKQTLTSDVMRRASSDEDVAFKDGLLASDEGNWGAASMKA